MFHQYISSFKMEHVTQEFESNNTVQKNSKNVNQS